MHTYNTVKLNLFSQSYGINITPLVINNLGGGHTHTHTYKHTHIQTDKSYFKKPGTNRPATGVNLI